MSTLRRIGLLLVIVFVSGCGGDVAKQPTVKVTGIVTYEGEPVEGATVVFGAAAGQERGASGITDATGRFNLTTYEKDDGAIVGPFTVAIFKTETTGGMSPDEEHKAIAAGQQVKAAETVDKLPAKYKDGPKSGLTADVAADRENHFEFKLAD